MVRARIPVLCFLFALNACVEEAGPPGDAIIISMDWDDDPMGPAAAETWFADRSADNGVIIYASDVSKWDGTAKYVPDGPRERVGLPPVAIGIDGLSIHTFE